MARNRWPGTRNLEELDALQTMLRRCQRNLLKRAELARRGSIRGAGTSYLFIFETTGGTVTVRLEDFSSEEELLAQARALHPKGARCESVSIRE